jgi:DNA processing protein
MHYARIEDWTTLPELIRLNDLANPPKNLYFAGTWDSTLFRSCTAVVGSRKMTDYGRRVLEIMIPRLVFEKKTVVSGFMYGVDQCAHTTCIQNGGKTIAVLGWGIKTVLEGAEKKLAESIISHGGLLISEWEDQKPTLWTFPVRNRIVAALSSDVVVVEAAKKSGSLITAAIAQKLNRTLYAVPGPITSKTSAGTNSLIAQGCATMWANDVHSESVQTFSDPLLALLSDEPLTTNDAARALGKPVSDIGAQLSLLLLEGKVIEQGGKYFLNYAHKN